MSEATRVVYFYDCNCDWISKYCDDHHQVSVRVPLSYLRDPVEHDRQVAERAWDEGHLVHGEDYRHNGYCRDSGGCIAVNPYRKEQENGDPR